MQRESRRARYPGETAGWLSVLSYSSSSYTIFEFRLFNCTMIHILSIEIVSKIKNRMILSAHPDGQIVQITRNFLL